MADESVRGRVAPASADDTLRHRTTDEAGARVELAPGERRGLLGSRREQASRKKERRRQAKRRRAADRRTSTRVAFFHYSYYGPVFK